MTIEEFYNWAVSNLDEVGIANAKDEVKILISEIAHISRSELLLKSDSQLADEELDELKTAVERRIKHEPLQYILGNACFMGLDFFVDENVLIPRPDTENLVEEVLKVAPSGSVILDMCSGSGCILISLLKFTNDCIGVGVDISEGALAVAKRNAQALIPEEKALFLQSNLFEDIRDNELVKNHIGKDKLQFDIIVSNPPYIESSVIDTLMPEVRDFEPNIALDGSVDGLEFYRKIVAASEEFLIPGGMIFFEIGYNQGQAVKSLLNEKGYLEVSVLQDYAGLDRVVYGTKPILIN